MASTLDRPVLRARGAGRAGAALVAVSLALCSGCERRGPGQPARSAADLEIGLARVASVELRAGEESLLPHLERAARVLARRTGWRVSAPAPGEPGARGSARVVVGSFRDPEVGELLAALGARVGPAEGRRVEVEYEGLRLRGAGAVLRASFEDPRRPGLPVALIAGASLPSILPLLEDLRIPARPAVEVRLRGATVLEQRLALDGSPRRGTARGTAAARGAWRGFPAPVETRDAGLSPRVAPGVDRERAAQYVAQAERARVALRAWLDRPLSEGPISFALVAESAQALQRCGRVALAAPEPLSPAITVLLSPGLPHDSGAAVARASLLQSLGPPAEPWLLDGAAIDAAGAWWGVELERGPGGAPRWLPALAEIVDAGALDRHSMHVLAPARGLLFRFLRERLGAAALLAMWRGEAGPSLVELELEFRAAFGALGPPVPARARRPEGAGFVRGLAIDSLLAPGGSVASRSLGRSLAEAARHGADAFSFTSYSYVRPPDPALPGGRLSLGLESVEGDAALAAAIATARASGARTILLQPHVLAGESGGHWAWRHRTLERDWDEFFDAFEPWLLHYALLAEHTGCDILCVGTEILPLLYESGVKQEVMEHIARRWTAAIAKVRSVYGGALTYAARWPHEALALPFWEQLDFVGATLYPDLLAADGSRPDERALELALQRDLGALADFAREQGRPLLLVELGFRSTRLATYEGDVGPGELDLEEQLRCYRQLARALAQARRASDSLAGLFVWKWEVDPLASPAAARGFGPRGKPAEGFLAQLLGNG